MDYESRGWIFMFFSCTIVLYIQKIGKILLPYSWEILTHPVAIPAVMAIETTMVISIAVTMIYISNMIKPSHSLWSSQSNHNYSIK